VDEKAEEGWTFEASPICDADLKSFYDPLENLNRLMFKINNVFDTLVFRPIATMYVVFLPSFVQKAVENFAYNFFAPVRCFNFLLQKDGESVVKTLFAYLINIAFGFFGVLDTASKLGLETRDTSFGKTLKKWGAKPGPFIVLPILGPSSLRGAFGKVVQTTSLDPIALISLYRCKKNTKNKFYYTVYCADLLAKRSKLLYILKELEDASPDPYDAVRATVMSSEQ
jgi:phospholipid-binding lipoprotein MlaA